MELINLTNMKKITLLLLVCLFTNCTKDTYEAFEPTYYDYYHLTEETTINASKIGNGAGTFQPKSIAAANGKVYICNENALEVFDTKTLTYIKTISSYTKGTTTIPFTKLTSVCVDNGRIYVGSYESQVFVIDEITNLGINTVGNGKYWDSNFIHVLGLAVKEGLLFIKEKDNFIKVFEASQITETSNWKLQPIAKLNTIKGYYQEYSMDVSSGSLVVAGQGANSFLYYNISDIRANAASSLVTPLMPTTRVSSKNEPYAISFSTDWTITSENIEDINYLRLYPKKQFLDMTFTPTINVIDIMGRNPIERFMSVAQGGDFLFLSDYDGKKIRVLKINKIKISEQK